MKDILLFFLSESKILIFYNFTRSLRIITRNQNTVIETAKDSVKNALRTEINYYIAISFEVKVLSQLFNSGSLYYI